MHSKGNGRAQPVRNRLALDAGPLYMIRATTAARLAAPRLAAPKSTHAPTPARGTLLASTLQVANALIRADKYFDMRFIPGAGHGSGGQ